MTKFESWKSEVLGKQLLCTEDPSDRGQCSQVPLSWATTLFPNVPWNQLFKPSPAAKDMFANANPKYFQAIKNDPKDVNQLPMQGDVGIFDATPKKPYTNQYKNPWGHAGVFDSASPSGYTLVQQDAPNNNEPVNDSSYPWSLNPCIGWLRPIGYNIVNPAPVPPASSSMVGKTLTLPEKNPDGTPDTIWHVYHEDGPYDLHDAIHVLDPAEFHGLHYQILRDLGNGIYVIQTEMFGRVAIWTKNTNAIIS